MTNPFELDDTTPDRPTDDGGTAPDESTDGDATAGASEETNDRTGAGSTTGDRGGSGSRARENRPARGDSDEQRTTGTDRTGSARDGRLGRYVAGDEEVEIVSRGSTRLFAVTDRRLLDISKGETTAGRPAEFVQTTLFSNVARGNLSLRESITEINWLQRIVAGFLVLIALSVFAVAVEVNSGDITAVLVLGGLITLALAAWLWLTSTTESPGGIVIELYHDTPREDSMVSYTLPEDQKETARAVIRMVGAADDAAR
ncbi:hypothetical protein Hbl1158_15870 (plasmid) [Halobaculum sp. CBA1158]|uniref:hypothetical protein n=1 Tax=Halobaculum sp. CBA1158 TaxID=2904243 RepID=UPI001F2163AA|nr:hypothetical protein [Halobaculum sp. CBA1158]UIP01385.1 hypothetical protein Hbl1158_15870 [Halobaculum sp. CBA1158]